MVLLNYSTNIISIDSQQSQQSNTIIWSLYIKMVLYVILGFFISYTPVKGVFRTLSNIYNGAFCEIAHSFQPFTIFARKLHYRCLIWSFHFDKYCFHRSSHHRCSVKKGLRPATIFKKRLWHRYFPVNFAKFLRTPFLQNTSGRLLLLSLENNNMLV